MILREITETGTAVRKPRASGDDPYAVNLENPSGV